MKSKFAPDMRNANVCTGADGMTKAAKSRIVRSLRRGDQARIAEVVGTAPEYVKQVLRYRPGAKSAKARAIWRTADRLLKDRQRMTNDFRP